MVADRGMISAETIAELEVRGLLYILGVRERTDKLVRELVLDNPTPFVPLTVTKRRKNVDYETKAVTLAGRRYIVCRNHEEAKKDAADRAAIIASLERQLKKGDKALIGNGGYRRFLATTGENRFVIDRAKAEEDASSTASSCCAPTPTFHQPMPCSATSSWPWWSTPSAPPEPFRHASDLPQTRRDHPRARVVQLPRPRAEDGPRGSHRRTWPRRLVAGNPCRSRLADRDQGRAGWQTLLAALGAASSRQSCPACCRRRPAIHRPPARRKLTWHRQAVLKCSANVPRRRDFARLFNKLNIRGVEDQFDQSAPERRAEPFSHSQDPQLTWCRSKYQASTQLYVDARS